MVNNCVAYGCNTVYSPITKAKKIQLHSFPFKRPEVLNLWINAIRRKDWKPSRTSKLCSLHFTDEDYQVRPGALIRLLKEDAVPSIFNFPPHLQKPKSSRRVLKYKIEDEPNDVDKEIPCSVNSEKPTSGGRVLQNSTNVLNKESFCSANLRTTPVLQCKIKEGTDTLDMEVKTMSVDLMEDNTPEVKPLQTHAQTQTNDDIDILICLLRRQIKTLRQKLRRKDNKIASLKTVIQELKGNTRQTEFVTVVMEN